MVLPTGTVTFLFTDIDGSTCLWERHPEIMRHALARHDALLTAGIQQHGGVVVKHRGEGDSFFAVFARATDAVAAADALQQALVAEVWPTPDPLRVRMALHTGEAEQREGDYYGPAVNRCARLRAAAHGGQVLLSLATQELVRDQLPERVSLRDLGEQRLKDLTRSERVFQLLHPELPSEFPPLRSLNARVHNLPVQPTPLLGREKEIAAVRELLLQGMRLVTLMGPGGTGKTRLAQELAAELLDGFIDGVFFVSLASIRDPHLLVSTVAHTLQVPETANRPVLESLKEYLRDRQVLLVLDNFEQLLAAAPVVAELLALASRLSLLVTSRSALRLRGEKEFQVSPLALPDRQSPLPVEALSQYAAVELFIQRALDVRADFVLTNENAPAVAAICHKLDGLPLAIELAAARVRLFPPQALLGRLSSRLNLLTGGARGLPERQQSLRGAIAWSYDLLSETEKSLYRRLSVFVGGCTLQAAEVVCSASREAETQVLDDTTSLVDKSLLRQEEGLDGEPRFTMLETIREFGQEVLATAQEEAMVRGQHAAFFQKWAEQIVRKAEGLESALDAGSWLDALEGEHDNLRAALERCIDSGVAEVGLPLGDALGRLWALRGYLTEGREQLTRLLAMPEAAEPTVARAKVLLAAATLAFFQADGAAGRVLGEESLAIGRKRGDPEIIGRSLRRIAILERAGGNFEVARALLEESLTIARSQEDRVGIADSLFELAAVAMWDDPPTARTLLEESLTTFRAMNRQGGIAWTSWRLGSLLRQQGDYGAAQEHYREGLRIFREQNQKFGIAMTLFWMGVTARLQSAWEAARSLLEESVPIYRELGNRGEPALQELGRVATHQGDLSAARAFYQEALTLGRELMNHPQLAECLEGFADVMGAQGHRRRSVVLFAAAAALREAADAPLLPLQCTDNDSKIAALRAALGEADFMSAWTEGRAKSIEQAIEYALQVVPNSSTTGQSGALEKEGTG